MKVFGICGSPRNSTTYYVLKEALNKLNNNGFETELFSCSGKNIGPCMHCDYCLEHKKCEYMSELYPEGSGKQDNFFAAFSDAMAKNIKNMRGKKASRDEEPDCGDELPDVRKTDDGTNSDDKKF